MISFKTPGPFPLTAFTTFGVNAKPSTESPLGFFGTGLKYAVAITLRLGGKFRLFTEGMEYEFYVKQEDFRGKEFGIVRMRKRSIFTSRWSYTRLPFTTELGKHWEPWMALRELWTNTVDENGEVCDYEVDHIEGYSYVEVECPEIENAFSDECVFRPEGRLIADLGDLQIYEGESPYLFYRNLRINKFDRPSKYTYNFTRGVDLTEDRTAKYYHYLLLLIMRALLNIQDEDVIETILTLKDDEYMESNLSWDDTDYATVETPMFRNAIGAAMSSGVKMPRRMKALHERMFPPIDDDPTIAIVLTRNEWRRVLADEITLLKDVLRYEEDWIEDYEMNN